MGNAVARRFEMKLGKPTGWMDTMHPDDRAEQLLADYTAAPQDWQQKLRDLAKADRITQLSLLRKLRDSTIEDQAPPPSGPPEEESVPVRKGKLHKK